MNGYLFGYEYELLCGGCVTAYGLFTFAICHKDVGCMPCLAKCVLKQRAILRSIGVS